MTMKKAADRFWTHALSVYGSAEAREAFLRLQDRDGADVPMLLWCLWCGSEGLSLSPETMSNAVQFSSSWQRQVVAPLRGIRREMKPGVENAPAELTTEAREKVAKTEQDAERLQMTYLATLASEKCPEAAADAYIALYAEMAGLSLSGEDVTVILEQADRLASH